MIEICYTVVHSFILYGPFCICINFLSHHPPSFLKMANFIFIHPTPTPHAQPRVPYTKNNYTINNVNIR